MSKIQLAKKIIATMAGLSSSWAVTNVIASNVITTKLHHKVQALVGGYVLGSYVGAHMERYAGQKFDDALDWWNNNIKKS